MQSPTSNSHGVQDLVISCIDYRFRANVASWIKTNLTDKSDLIAVAGTSKALITESSREYVIGLIKIGIDLHGVNTIHLLDHQDCGAYGGSKEHTDDRAELNFHNQKLEEAEIIIKQTFPQLTVNKYVMTLSEVKQLTLETVAAH